MGLCNVTAYLPKIRDDESSFDGVIVIDVTRYDLIYM